MSGSSSKQSLHLLAETWYDLNIVQHHILWVMLMLKVNKRRWWLTVPLLALVAGLVVALASQSWGWGIVVGVLIGFVASELLHTR